MAMFSLLSAHGADMTAAARTGQRRLRGWLVAGAGAALLAIPVVIGAAIRTKAEANRQESRGGLVHADDAVIFLMIQFAFALLALCLAHAHAYLKRTRARRRDQRYQQRVIADGNAAKMAQIEFHGGEERQHNLYLEAIVNGFIALRRTVQAAMPDWAPRNHQDFTGFGFTDGGPVWFLDKPLVAVGAGDPERPDTHPGDDFPPGDVPPDDVPPADGPGPAADPEPEASSSDDEPTDAPGETTFWDDLITPRTDGVA
jgi:hypothetical protein